MSDPQEKQGPKEQKDLDNRGQKAVDIASTYIQVLIGLASGIITAVLTFYPDIITIENFRLQFLQVALLILGLSIGCGLLGLGGLVYSTADSSNRIPTDTRSVRFSVIGQLIAFGLGITFVIAAIPFEKTG